MYDLEFSCTSKKCSASKSKERQYSENCRFVLKVLDQSVILKAVNKALKTKISPLQAVSSRTPLQAGLHKNKILVYLELKKREDNKSGRAKFIF